MPVSLLEDGAQIVGYSSVNSANPADQPQNAIDLNPASSWCTANGMVTDQWIKVQLRGSQTFLVDRLVIKSAGNLFSPKDIQLWTTASGSADADFHLAFSGTARKDNRVLTFDFPPVEARFVKLVVKNAWNNYAYIQIHQVQVWARDL